MPKRLCYLLQRDTALQGMVLRIFVSVVERCLREHRPGCSESARIGAVAFIHRFGSSLRTKIDQLLGGAGEETIMARVGEGMGQHHRLGHQPRARAGEP